MAGKKKEQSTVEGSPYGEFHLKDFPKPNIKRFKLRYDALRLNDEFRKFCAMNPKEPDVPSPEWKDIDKFMETANNVEKCLCFYGNIFNKPYKMSLNHFLLQYVNVFIRTRGVYFGFNKLTPGTKAPTDALTVSFDPTLNKGTLIKMFKKFVDKEKQSFLYTPGSMPGYFTWRTTTISEEEIGNYLSVYELKKKNPKMTWRGKASRLFPPSMEEKTRQRYITRYAKNGEYLVYWVVQGVFPEVSNPLK